MKMVLNFQKKKGLFPLIELLFLFFFILFIFLLYSTKIVYLGSSSPKQKISNDKQHQEPSC